MKKFLVFLFVCVAITIQAQVINYRTTKFYTSENTGYGWTNWSNPLASNLLMQIDWDKALVFINSNQQQLYQIVSVNKKYRDNDGDDICEMSFIDQDGDRGTMRLVLRRDGRSQVYVIFNNVRWCYDVVRL